MRKYAKKLYKSSNKRELQDVTYEILYNNSIT